MEGQRYVSQVRRPIVVLASDPNRRHPYYPHVTDGVLGVLHQLNMEFPIFTSAFLYELPDNQIVKFCSPEDRT